MLNRRMEAQICEWFGTAEVDLFALSESTQCPLWFSLSHPTSRSIDALTHLWPDMKLYAFPPVKLIPAVLCRVKMCGVCLLLVALCKKSLFTSGFATVRTLLLLLCALLSIFVLFSDLSKIFASADQHSAQTTIFLGKRGLFASHCQQFTFRRQINTAVYIQTDERKCL